MKQSDWMKQAAAEKITRENNHQDTYREEPTINGIDSFLDSL